jgi:predicted dehydrogenase
MSERRLRLGFVGCGFMGQLAHLENYARLPNVELVALAEGRPRLAQLVAECYGIRRLHPDHRALAADPEIDAVVSVMGFDLNYGVVRDLLAAGKHVATEKAMCLTVEGAQELVEAAAAAGRVYQVGYMKRFDPAVLLAREWIAARRADEAYGPLLYARIWCAHGAWEWGTPPPLRTDEKPPAYDAPREPRPADETPEEFRWVVGWLNYYSHQTNLLRWLLGEDYTVDQYTARPACDLVLVRSASGVPAFMEFPHYQVAGWDEGFQCHFQRAMLRVDLPAPLARQQSGKLTIATAGEGARTESPYVPPRWAFAEQARGFVAAALVEGPPISPPEDAAKEVALAHELVARRRGGEQR